MQLSKNNVRKMQRVRVSVLCGHGGVGGKGVHHVDRLSTNTTAEAEAASA